MTDSQKLDMILSEFQDFKTEMQDFKSGIKTEMQDFKSEMKTEMQDFKSEMKTEMQDFKSEVKTEIQDLKYRVTDIELHLENNTDRNIQLLTENHLTLVDKLNEAIKVSSNTYLYEIKVNLLTERVDKLEQEVSELKSSKAVCKTVCK